MQACIFEEKLVLGPKKHEFKRMLLHFQTIKVPIEGIQSESEETPINISLSVYTLLHEFKPVFLEKDELEYQDRPIQ